MGVGGCGYTRSALRDLWFQATSECRRWWTQRFSPGSRYYRDEAGCSNGFGGEMPFKRQPGMNLKPFTWKF